MSEISGWLHKRGRHMHKKWNPRFFVAQGATVRYYLRRGDAHVRNSFVLRPGTTLSLIAQPPQARSKSSQPTPYCFRLDVARADGVPAERLLLAADSARERKAWVDYLANAVSEGGDGGAAHSLPRPGTYGSSGVGSDPDPDFSIYGEAMQARGSATRTSYAAEAEAGAAATATLPLLPPPSAPLGGMHTRRERRRSGVARRRARSRGRRADAGAGAGAGQDEDPAVAHTSGGTGTSAGAHTRANAHTRPTAAAAAAPSRSRWRVQCISNGLRVLIEQLHGNAAAAAEESATALALHASVAVFALAIGLVLALGALGTGCALGGVLARGLQALTAVRGAAEIAGGGGGGAAHSGGGGDSDAAGGGAGGGAVVSVVATAAAAAAAAVRFAWHAALRAALVATRLVGTALPVLQRAALWLATVAAAAATVAYSYRSALISVGRRSSPRLRARARINAAPVALLRKLLHAEDLPRWDMSVAAARVVRRLDAQSDVLHVVFKPPALWPLPPWIASARPRDACWLRSWQRHSDGGFTIQFHPTSSPLCPPVPGRIRV
eukprot:g7846.t1